METIDREKAIDLAAREGSQIELAVAELKIRSQDDYVTATTLVSRIVTALKKLKETEAFFTKPLKEQVDAIKAKFAPLRAPLETAEASAREKMRGWLRDEEMRQQAEQRKRDEDYRRQQREAKKLGEDAPERPLAVQEPPKTVKTAAGSSTAVKVPAHKIVDLAKVPEKYLKPRELSIVAVNAAIRAAEAAKPGADVTQLIPGLVCIWEFSTKIQA